MTTEKPVEFSTSEVAEFANVTPRMLQNWDEIGVLKPRHAGHRRFYTEAQLDTAKRLATLRKAGVSLKQAVHVVRRFRNLSGPVLVVGKSFSKPAVLCEF